jgi:hypothetical protein
MIIHHLKILVATLLLAFGLLTFYGIGQAQVGGLSIPWFSVDGGGGRSSNAEFTVQGTVGQPDAGNHTNGAFTVRGGFWQSSVAANPSTLYLPVIFKDFIAAPDLKIESLSAGSTGVMVVIKNIGAASVTNAFWVDVYFNPNPAPPQLNQPWDAIAEAGAVWGITGVTLDPGESLILTSGGAYYFLNLSSPFFPAGAQVYAYVDSINYSTSYGNVQESDEGNNVFGPVVSTTGDQGPATGAAVGIPSLEELPER